MINRAETDARTEIVSIGSPSGNGGRAYGQRGSIVGRRRNVAKYDVIVIDHE